MKYEEAMEAVKRKPTHPPEDEVSYASVLTDAEQLKQPLRPDDFFTDGQRVARRREWAEDSERCRRAVIFIEVWVREADTREEAFEYQLQLNDFSDSNVDDWSWDNRNSRPWFPSDEDMTATDWEIVELWWHR
jgi:hypothetical protein